MPHGGSPKGEPPYNRPSIPDRPRAPLDGGNGWVNDKAVPLLVGAPPHAGECGPRTCHANTIVKMRRLCKPARRPDTTKTMEIAPIRAETVRLIFRLTRQHRCSWSRQSCSDVARHGRRGWELFVRRGAMMLRPATRSNR